MFLYDGFVDSPFAFESLLQTWCNDHLSRYALQLVKWLGSLTLNQASDSIFLNQNNRIFCEIAALHKPVSFMYKYLQIYDSLTFTEVMTLTEENKYHRSIHFVCPTLTVH